MMLLEPPRVPTTISALNHFPHLPLLGLLQQQLPTGLAHVISVAMEPEEQLANQRWPNTRTIDGG